MYTHTSTCTYTYIHTYIHIYIHTQGLTVIPHNWYSCRHPKITEKTREEEQVSAGGGSILKFLTQRVMPAGYNEKYGVESIRRKVNAEHPEWQISKTQV